MSKFWSSGYVNFEAIIFKFINPDAKMPEKIKEIICEMMLRLTGTDITLCPECKKGTPKVSQESCDLAAIIYRKRIEN